MIEAIKNWKLHILVLIFVIVAEWIGAFSFPIGPGKVVLLPMLYALIMGIFSGPKFLKLANHKDMIDAGSLIGVTLMLLMAKYGTTVGPNIPMILRTSPALILQEFGNLGTVIIGVPVAVYLGLRRETIGAAHSIAREPNVALIGDIYGCGFHRNIHRLYDHCANCIKAHRGNLKLTYSYLSHRLEA